MCYITLDILLSRFIPILYLIYATARVFVKRNTVAFDKLGIFGFDKELIVLCIVLT